MNTLKNTIIVTLFTIILSMSNGTSVSAATSTNEAQQAQLKSLLETLKGLQSQVGKTQTTNSTVPASSNTTVREKLQNATAFAKKKGGIKMDKETRLDSAAVSDDNKMVYSYTLTSSKSDSTKKSKLKVSFAKKLNAYCTDSRIAWYRDNNVSMVWSYASPKKVALGSFEANNEKCAQITNDV